MATPHPDKFKPIPVRPLGTRGGNQVWLELEDDPKFSPSGLLHLPPHGETYGDDGKRAPVFAVVVAIGPGRILSKIDTVGTTPEFAASIYVDGTETARFDGEVW